MAKKVFSQTLVSQNKMQTHSATVYTQMQKANELDEAIKLYLTKIGYAL